MQTERRVAANPQTKPTDCIGLMTDCYKKDENDSYSQTELLQL